MLVLTCAILSRCEETSKEAQEQHDSYTTDAAVTPQYRKTTRKAHARSHVMRVEAWALPCTESPVHLCQADDA